MLMLLMKADHKSLETEFLIAICRPMASKTLFLVNFDPPWVYYKSVFDCRLPNVFLVKLGFGHIIKP